MRLLIAAAGTLLSASLAWSISPLVLLKQEVGKAIFYDESLSEPRGQSCATCHSPKFGFNGNGDPNAAVIPGAFPGRAGTRNPPSAAYAFGSPAGAYRTVDGEVLYIGGQFWDGRASSLAEQAKAPFLNPVEMNNPSPAAVVNKVCGGVYGILFRLSYGQGICTPGQTAAAYDAIGEAISLFEQSREMNPFNSRYDAYLAGTGQLTPKERRGLQLFEGKAGCAGCHPSGPGSPFTDFSYDNIGIPRNTRNQHTAAAPMDLGLGARLGSQEDGRFKVPTLRNAAIAPPYGHNGYFRTLQEVVHFYNTRDTDPRWPRPEVKHNLNRDELGNLGLTADEEDAIVAFLGSLTDR